MTAKGQGLLQIEKNGDRGTRIEGQGRGRYMGTRLGLGHRQENTDRDRGTEKLKGAQGQREG